MASSNASLLAEMFIESEDLYKAQLESVNTALELTQNLDLIPLRIIFIELHTCSTDLLENAEATKTAATDDVKYKLRVNRINLLHKFYQVYIDYIALYDAIKADPEVMEQFKEECSQDSEQLLDALRNRAAEYMRLIQVMKGTAGLSSDEKQALQGLTDFISNKYKEFGPKRAKAAKGYEFGDVTRWLLSLGHVEGSDEALEGEAEDSYEADESDEDEESKEAKKCEVQRVGTQPSFSLDEEHKLNTVPGEDPTLASAPAIASAPARALVLPLLASAPLSAKPEAMGDALTTNPVVQEMLVTEMSYKERLQQLIVHLTSMTESPLVQEMLPVLEAMKINGSALHTNVSNSMSPDADLTFLRIERMELLGKFFEQFKIYIPLYERIMTAEGEAFRDALSKKEPSESVQINQSLIDPIQRGPRYRLLLEELIKKPEDLDVLVLNGFLKQIQDSLAKVNELGSSSDAPAASDAPASLLGCLDIFGLFGGGAAAASAAPTEPKAGVGGQNP